MRLTELTLLALLCAALVAGAGCGGGQSAEPTPTPTPNKSELKPSAGHLPEFWYEIPVANQSGLCKDNESTDWEELYYCNMVSATGDSVTICYGDIPPSLKGHESDIDALITKASEMLALEADETGTVNVSGQAAGYAKACDPHLPASLDCAIEYMQIVFIENSTCIAIHARYGSSIRGKSDVMELIDSIKF